MYELIEEYSDFIVINKFTNVSFHKHSDEIGLFRFVKKEKGMQELYPVHRLDRMTSGLLILAKNKPSAKELSAMFRNKRIEKYYLALSDKKPKKKQGLIKGDMVKSRRGSWRLSRTNVNPSITQYFSFSEENGMRLFILKPHTGKTHQLRVALKSVGSPVLGDSLYNKKGSIKLDRGYLHSYVLRFYFDNREYCFVKIPEYGKYFTDKAFLNVMEKYKRPWELKWPKISY